LKNRKIKFDEEYPDYFSIILPELKEWKNIDGLNVCFAEHLQVNDLILLTYNKLDIFVLHKSKSINIYYGEPIGVLSIDKFIATHTGR